MRGLPVLLGSIGVAAALGAGVRAGSAGDQPPARHVVVAELFTSEGCSSCPPADALLQRIAAQSPVAGVEILALEEHVDYWDNLGWRDPFSSASFTRRQTDYESRVFHLGDIYTPQLVVDGAFVSVGSDARSVRDSIAKAAARPGANVRVAAHTADGRVHVEVAIDGPASIDRRKDADIVAALVEDGLTTKVERGENRGRTLAHFAVVRSLTSVGSLPSSASTGAASADLPLARGWERSRLRVVAFVQERDSRRILGSARDEVNPQGAPPAAVPRAEAAAARSPARPAIADSHVDVKTSVTSRTVVPGEPFALHVEVKPASGVHVYAPGVAGYRPIALHLDPQPGLVSGRITFPESDDLYLPVSREHVPVYEKPFQIEQAVTIDRPPTAVHAFAAHNDVTFSGRLEYQACTESVCFPPQSVPLSWTVAVASK